MSGMRTILILLRCSVMLFSGIVGPTIDGLNR